MGCVLACQIVANSSCMGQAGHMSGLIPVTLVVPRLRKCWIPGNSTPPCWPHFSVPRKHSSWSFKATRSPLVHGHYLSAGSNRPAGRLWLADAAADGWSPALTGTVQSSQHHFVALPGNACRSLGLAWRQGGTQRAPSMGRASR